MAKKKASGSRGQASGGEARGQRPQATKSDDAVRDADEVQASGGEAPTQAPQGTPSRSDPRKQQLRERKREVEAELAECRATIERADEAEASFRDGERRAYHDALATQKSEEKRLKRLVAETLHAMRVRETELQHGLRRERDEAVRRTGNLTEELNRLEVELR